MFSIDLPTKKVAAMRLKYEPKLLARLEALRREFAEADFKYQPELQGRLRREAFGEQKPESLPHHDAPATAPERKDNAA